MSEENVDIMRAMIDAFNRDDIEEVVAAFAEDCEIHEPPEMPDRLAAGYRGHEGVREWAHNLRRAANVRFEPLDVSNTGEVVVSEWVARGRGMSSGVPIRWTSFVVLQIRDGKIARADAFLNKPEAFEAGSTRR
jgi:ketosteroid isomerase-like protein